MKKLIIKNIDSAGDTIIVCNTPEEVLEKIHNDRATIMVMPDGRTCESVDHLLEMIQEDVYKPLDEVQVYRLPILAGG